jgi:hypothetical protein
MQRSSLWDALKEHYEKEIKSTHLRTLLQDEKRNSALKIELPNLVFDFSHHRSLLQPSQGRRLERPYQGHVLRSIVI